MSASFLHGTAYRIFFNKGCDSRIAGQPITSCRFPGTTDARRHGFEAGWKQVDTEWGLDAKWPVKRLPEVK